MFIFPNPNAELNQDNPGPGSDKGSVQHTAVKDQTATTVWEDDYEEKDEKRTF